MEAAQQPWPALGVLLMRDGLVSREEVEAAVAEQDDRPGQRVSSQRLGQALVDQGLVTSEQIARLVAEQHELPFVEVSEAELPLHVARRLSEDVARRCAAVPISSFPDGSLVVAIADPTDVGSMDEVRRTLAAHVRFAVAASDSIGRAIDLAHSQPEPTLSVYEAPADPSYDEHDDDFSDDAMTPAFSPVEESLQTGPAEHSWPVLGSLLVGNGLITEEELGAALAQQRLTQTKRLGEILVARGTLTEPQVARVLAEQHEFPYIDLREVVPDPAAVALLPLDVARRHAALPVSFLPEGSVLVAVADPTGALSSDEIRVAVGGAVRFGVAAAEDLRAAIDALEAEGSREEPHEAINEVVETGPAPAPAPEVHELEAVAPTAPFAPIADVAGSPTVGGILRDALAEGATSVHFTSRDDCLTVHARVDRVERELTTIADDGERRAVESELAAWAGAVRSVDAETGDDQPVNVRVVGIPTTYGERFTIRVLADASSGSSAADVIAADGAAAPVGEAVELRSGMFVICGPAGSGRTATLYALLRELRDGGRAVTTIEEEVNALIGGVEQTEIDPRTGLTVASGLHSLLRADPDVVAVDEVVDSQTARLATRGARNALVVATLEAASAAAGVVRLLALGVEPDRLGAALDVVVAQRLLQRTCSECRESYFATSEELALLGRPPEETGRRLLGRGRGCDSCRGTGYRGHVAVSEALVPSDEVRASIARRPTAEDLEQAAVAAGMRTLHESAVASCLEGETTAAEVRLSAELRP